MKLPQTAAPYVVLGVSAGLLLAAILSFTLGGLFGPLYLGAGGVVAMLALAFAVRSGSVEAQA